MPLRGANVGRYPLLLDPVTQADAWPPAILIDKFDAGRLKGGADLARSIVAPSKLAVLRFELCDAGSKTPDAPGC